MVLSPDSEAQTPLWLSLRYELSLAEPRLHSLYLIPVLHCLTNQYHTAAESIKSLVFPHTFPWMSNVGVFQVYELLLYYSGHTDHNVVTAALETLHQLLRNTPPQLRHLLVTKGSIKSTSIFEKDVPESMGSRASSKYR